jgi:hypothetical protein
MPIGTGDTDIIPYWTFAKNNQVEDLSVEQFNIGSIDSSGANGQFTFGNNNKVDDLAVQQYYISP